MPFKQLPYHRPDYFLFSSQKSGRTWVRMVLAKVLEEKGQDPFKIEMIPSFHTSYAEITRHKKWFKKNIIFLYRDPRDCVVSRYFEISHRRIRPKTSNPNKVYNSTLSDYIRRSDQYGIDAIIEYMNQWWHHRDYFAKFLTLSYENLKNNPIESFQEIVNFIDVDCPSDDLQRAVQYASFDNMRKIEKSGEGNLIQNYHGTFGERHKSDDPESMRVRRGQIGGFVDYLSEKDILYVNDRIKNLDPFFQYD